jgi:predicted metal-dependent peptidase
MNGETEFGQALARVERAKALLIRNHPFFGVLIARLGAPVAHPSVTTMATDGRKLYMHAGYVLSLTEPELIGVLAHEAFHCALLHFARIGARDLKEFNIAADSAINWELRRMGFTLPRGVYIDDKFADMGAEEIYAARAAEKRKEGEKKAAEKQSGAPGQGDTGKPGNASGAPGKADSGQGKPGDSAGQGAPQSGNAPGNGAPGEGKPGNGAPAPENGAPVSSSAPGDAGTGNGAPGNGTPDMGAPGADIEGGQETHGIGGIMRPGDGSGAAAAEIAAEWQIATRQAARAAEKMAGTTPGMFKRIVEEIAAPEIDVANVMRDFIDSKVSTDYSFNRPNRRFAHAGVYLPGQTVDGLAHLVFAVDTSGSIDAPMLDKAASVVIDAAEGGKVERLTVIFADTDVRNVQEFDRGDDIRAGLDARGGGGTRFDRTFAWIEENAPDATAVIYLTDMICNHWGTDPGIPVLWAVHGDSRKFAAMAERAPFGRAEYVGRLE